MYSQRHIGNIVPLSRPTIWQHLQALKHAQIIKVFKE